MSSVQRTGEVITLGEEFGRRGQKKVVAVSRVSLNLRTDDDVRRCVEALRASDALLADKPAEERLYDWQVGVIVDKTVVFGVAWYDRTFFEARRDAFRSTDHGSLFASFGATVDDLHVQHFLSAD